MPTRAWDSQYIRWKKRKKKVEEEKKKRKKTNNNKKKKIISRINFKKDLKDPA
jgi:hypothetical protein